MNLDAVRAVRLREIAWERYGVSRHPMNVYPEGHVCYSPPLPKPPDRWETERLRREGSKALWPLWDSGVRVGAESPPEGSLALWRVHVGVIWPVRLAREQGCAWYVERLDDPPSPPSRSDPSVPRYAHPAWYRAEWWDLRLLTYL